ncbi:male sterility protein [Botrytis cinerea]
MFSQETEYASGHLFTPHPSKPNLWKWHARADDIIVSLNGEKTNPISMEQLIVARSSEVQAAFVMSAQRFQASILIDPAHAKIAKTHIFFTNRTKRMLIVGKGTIQRAGTLKLYEEELDALYADADSMATEIDGEAFSNIDIADLSAVSEFIKKAVVDTTFWSSLDMNEDIFAWGMDSLQALTVVRKLRHGLGIASITSSTLYTNPSIARLASTAVKILTDEKSIDSQQITGQLRDSMLKEFRSRIDSLLLPPPTSHRKVDTNHEIVILTGSTGTLDSYILGSLLLTPGVAHIYCLNRSSLGRNLRDSRDQSADIADS